MCSFAPLSPSCFSFAPEEIAGPGIPAEDTEVDVLLIDAGGQPLGDSPELQDGSASALPAAWYESPVRPSVFVGDCAGPHIAPLNTEAAPYRLHANTGSYIQDEGTGGILTYGYNCHAMAFHAGEGHPASPAEKPSDFGAAWDDTPTRDMMNAKKLAATDRIRVGDVLVYGYDKNGNGRFDKDSEAWHSTIVMEIDEQGRAIRVAGKEGAAEVSDHHPAQPHPGYISPEGCTMEWYRPRESTLQRQQRLNFAQSKVQADTPIEQRVPIDWFHDPRMSSVTASTPTARVHAATSESFAMARYNPHLFAWSNRGGNPPTPSNPDDLWGANPISSALAQAHRLGPADAVRVGDVLVYALDENRDQRIELNEIQRSAIVTKVDGRGRAVRVASVEGLMQEVSDYHPRQPAEGLAGSLSLAQFYRPKETGEQRKNRLDFALGK